MFCMQPAFSKEPKVIQISSDTYEIYKEDKKGIFGNAQRMKVEIFQQANEFAASKGKAALPVSAIEMPVGGWMEWASFKYTFRLVEVNDPVLKRTQFDMNSNLVVTKPDEKGATNISIVSQEKTDIYSELIKLEDLRKRGILTDAEFDAQKKKLLEGQ